MPIKFACSNCQQQLEVSRQHAGAQFKCPKCGTAVTAPQPSGGPAPSPAASAPADVTPPIEQDEFEDQAPPRKRRRAGSAGVFSPPRDAAVFFLWVGLLMIMASFTLKHLTVDMALTGVPSIFKLQKLEAKQSAELFALEKDVQDIRSKFNDWQDEQNERAREGSLDREERDKQREEEKKWRKRISDAQKEASEDRKKIVDKYRDALWDARLAQKEAAPSFLGWIQTGIWVKIVVDLPKIIGCFLIVLATLPIVSDPEKDAGIKAYAIVCSGIVLIYATLYAVLAFFG